MVPLELTVETASATNNDLRGLVIIVDLFRCLALHRFRKSLQIRFCILKIIFNHTIAYWKRDGIWLFVVNPKP